MKTSQIPDLILYNGRITTLDAQHPEATESRRHGRAASPRGRRGGIRARTEHDDHRLEGCRDDSLPQRLASARHSRRVELQPGTPMGRRAVARRRIANAPGTGATHATGQWVRVVGGWSEFQFAERRMPTLG